MALPLIGMLVCVLAERYIVEKRGGRPAPWRDLVLNLNSGHILMWFLRGMEVAIFAWVSAHARVADATRWHPVVLWLVALLGWDLGFYWMHRLHHRFALLWSVHVVHHEGEHFNLSLGIRNAWASSLTTLPFTTLPLALLGVPVEVFVAVSTLHYTVQFYNHNALVGHSGWLERWFVTPRSHRVHHGQNREYRDRNFGGTFVLWDKLFGSFQPLLEDVPIRYGVAHPTPSTNPLWANLVPMLRYAKLPVPRLRASVDKRMSEFAVGSGGIVLFGIVAYYVHRDGTWPAHAQTTLFALIFAGTVALGAASDARRWGTACWCALALTSLTVMPLVFELRDPLGIALFAAWVLHAFMAAALGTRAADRTGANTPLR
jgi:sterol desaturase/sphingolipid hydroxylase (fatty acid hydroxylase superfamily)